MSFPLHPGDEGAQVGGLVACNAGGARAVKHGIMRNYVKGIEVVLPTGEVISLGGKVLKNNAGYDLLHLLVGSEGTLGIITRVILKLYPEFGATATLVVPYDDQHDALDTVPKILQRGMVPLAIEYVERDDIERSARDLGEEWPCKEGKAFLIMVVAGASVDEVYSECEKISTICEESNSLELLIAESREEQDRILNIRSHIYPTLKPETMDILDVVVPPAEIGKLMDEIDGIGRRFGIHIPTYGHAGDGNLHPHLMRGERQGLNNVKKVRSEIYKAAVALGGTITGEHGIGKVRTESQNLYLSGKEVQLARKVREVFDPNNVLNPS